MPESETDDDEANIDDIVGQLAYVSAHPEVFSPQDMVNVMKAAMVEILELRMAVGMARGKNS